MKKSSIWFYLITASLIILGSAIWLGGRWYGVIDAIQGVNLFYSKNEMFVFVGHSKAVLTGTRIRLMAEDFTSVLHIPDHVSDDMLAVHFKDGKVSTFEMKGIGYSGSAFVYDGDFYCYWGGELEQNSTWKWNGTNFVVMSTNEVEALYHEMHKTFKYVDESTHAEGWDSNFFSAGWKTNEATMHLQNGEIKVYADIQPMPNRRNEQVRIMLVQIGKTNAPETIIDIIEGYQKISKEEYLKLKTQKNVSSN